MMQTGKQDGKSRCQGTGSIEALKYENARNDFIVITEKNEKQYVRLHAAKYFREPHLHFHL